VDRSFAAAIDLELVTEEIVHLPVPEATPPPARPTGVHVFAEASGPASFDPRPAADPADAARIDEGADEDVDGDPDGNADGDADGAADASPGAGQQPAAELSGGGDPTRPRRRRRRRGGRGRGKPPDIRQNSE